MNIITTILTNTPWWVYLLFAYLIWVGVDASKTQIEPLTKVFIAPAIFTYLSIETLITAFHLSFFTVTIWSAGILLGAVLGAWFLKRYTMRVDRDNKLIEIPGTWSTLVIIILIFVTKYYFSYQLGVDPAKAQQTGFELSALGLSGLFTGRFIGGAAVYVYRYFTEPSVSLTE